MRIQVQGFENERGCGSGYRAWFLEVIEQKDNFKFIIFSALFYKYDKKIKTFIQKICA